MTDFGTLVEVYVDSPTISLDKPFDYRVPIDIEGRVQPGQRVFVSFANQFKAGIIWRVHHKVQIKDNVKPILSLIDDGVVLTDEQLQLAAWLCERYACTMNDALSSMLPGAFRVRGNMHLTTETVEHVPDDVSATELWRYVQTNNPTEKSTLDKFGKSIRLQLNAWIDSGYVLRRLRVKEDVREKLVDYVCAACDEVTLRGEASRRGTKARKQAELLQQLAECGEFQWDRRRFNHQTVHALVRDGLARIESRPKSRLALAERPPTTVPVLTPTQTSAFQHIEQFITRGERQRILLFGVTGSGKTEVYIRAIESTIALNKSAIVLVPEIALTPQMVGRFYARFGEKIAVLHSGLTMGERRDEWGRILRQEASIVIGARSAIFAPINNLGLIIVDEEHEPSYKQDESPHYDAREVAAKRADFAGAVTVFGSATPSLQSLYLVETGHSKIVTLPTRVNRRPLPVVAVVDMREELRDGNKSVFSERLQDEIETTLALRQQVILFLNRRGFAASMLCRACGERALCPHCDISLTVHRNPGGQMSMLCHYCGFQQPYSAVCPACKEPAMRAFGIGTEQIESTVQSMWPNVRTIRMDIDTTRKRGAFSNLIERFETNDADVLIGTQMIAKGLDFPNVRLVGVIAAETMLSVPDYRANERTFQLLTQVTGRAGRAETSGVTIVQTYRPEHFAVMAAARHDFDTFYREERTQRELFSYPPYCELAVLLTTHADETLARGAAMRFERELHRAGFGDDVVILPASPSGIRRIEDKFRYQVVLKYRQWDSIQSTVYDAFRMVKERMNRYGGTCRLDVNAQRIG